MSEAQYQALLKMRDQLCETLKDACDKAEKPSEGNSKLAEQNNKLKYRMTHLLRALVEAEKSKQ